MRRHNGLLSSCEPCRRSKLRCDHSVPTCGRCRRKGKTAACVYTQTTKRAPPVTTGSLQPTSPTLRTALHTSSGLRPHALRSRYIEQWSQRLAVNSTPSFLGLTSFSAVYRENEASLKQHSSILPLRPPELSPPGAAYTVDDRQVQLGAELLSVLFDNYELYRLTAVASDENISQGLMGLRTIRTLCDLVEEMYSNTSGHLDPPSRLLALSRRLFEGSTQEIAINETMTLDEYLKAFAGRWETIGLILTMSGICAAHTTVDDSLFQGRDLSAIEHKNLGIMATAGGDLCIQFCDSLGVMSDTLGWLLMRHVHLLTLVCGDFDYRPRKRLGELTTLLFAIGYHQLDDGQDLPFFLAEGRKRLMVTAYTCDKELATFLGCPPLIPYRFCRLQLPKDLTPTEVIAQPAVREAAIHKLDSNGWNTERLIPGNAWCRVGTQLGHVRELVLELSLDFQNQDIQQRADKISSLAQQVRSELPSYLQWDGSSETALSMTCTIPVYVHLDLLYSDFLLQRILVKRSITGSGNLVRLANQLLTAILVQIAVTHRCHQPVSELSWTIPYFGLPSAGILAIELLRQTQSPSSNRSDREPHFPRSEVIQNLSILASHIQYIILPLKGNYEVCQQGRKAILYILDLVLSTPASSTTSVPSLPNNLIPADWLHDEWLNDGTEFLEWVEGVDWDV